MYKEMYEHDDLVNLSEELVFEQIHQVIESGKVEFSHTSVTIQDIAAIALNKVPPKYICSFVEKQYPSKNLRKEVDTLRSYAKQQVLSAIEKVNLHPHE